MANDPSWAHLTRDYPRSAILPRIAEQVAAVHACVDAISSAIAVLPPRIRGPGGADVTDPVLLDVLRRPTPLLDWPDFVSWSLSQALVYGNSFCLVEGGPDGAARFIPVPWSRVEPHTYGAVDTAGDLSFTASLDNGRRRVTVGADRVMLLRDRSDDGVLGVSRLRRCSSVIDMAASTEAAARAIWDNGAFPSGALKVPGRLAPDRRAQLRSYLSDDFAGAANRSRVLILDAGSEWESISTDPRDAQTLESRQYQVEEICRVFNVPPPIVSDYRNNTFTNAATAGRWFAQFTLSSWVRRFEDAFSAAILSPGQRLELDMSAYTRADPGERWNAYKIALEAGVLQPDEVRRLEGWD